MGYGKWFYGLFLNDCKVIVCRKYFFILFYNRLDVEDKIKCGNLFYEFILFEIFYEFNFF